MKMVLRLCAALCVAAALASGPALAQPQQLDDVKVHDPADLEIGKVAPNIEAEDLDGVKFNLTDYRGKVVVIDFWGDW